jgi:hypothetical protein
MTLSRLSKATKIRIVDLAVAYQAFHTAVQMPDNGAQRDNGIICWGHMLMACQKQLGIKVGLQNTTINGIVANALDRENRRKTYGEGEAA